MGTNSINLSLKSIMKNKFRTFIAMFGITIWVSLLVVMFSILSIGKNRFNSSIDKMGGNFLKINVIHSDQYKKYNLNLGDVKALKDSNLSIEFISPEVYFNGYIGNKFDNLSCYIIGGTEDYKNFMMMDILHGRFFTDIECSNKENVILIDNITSFKLFGTENSVDREVYLSNGKVCEKYNIIGIVKYPSHIYEKSNNIVSFCVLPITNYCENFNGSEYFDYIYVSSLNENIYDISDNIISFLKVKNNVVSDVYKGENFLRPEYQLNDLNNVFTKIVRIVSIVFIILSGINITNVMLFSINDRRSEIGLKRVNGVSKLSIFAQFILECELLSFVGGIMGVVIGILGIVLINMVMNVNLSIDILDILGFLLLSLFMGVIFGLFPALKASNTPYKKVK